MNLPKSGHPRKLYGSVATFLLKGYGVMLLLCKVAHEQATGNMLSEQIRPKQRFLAIMHSSMFVKTKHKDQHKKLL